MGELPCQLLAVKSNIVFRVVSQMPVLGNASNPLGDLSQERAAPDEGRVGYYKSSLANGITVELTASEHAGLYRYTSPGTFSIVVDVSHVLPSFRGRGWEQHYSGGDFSVRDDGYYEGYGTYNNGWNLVSAITPFREAWRSRGRRH
jgi:putative alpha-1,2-mannosidase